MPFCFTSVNRAPANGKTITERTSTVTQNWIYQHELIENESSGQEEGGLSIPDKGHWCISGLESN